MAIARESIRCVHEEAEKHPFAQSLAQGTISRIQWDTYLFNWMVLHKTIEDRHLIKVDQLLRTDRLFYDLIDCRGRTPLVEHTLKYCEYLDSIDDDKLWSHIYVHYLAHLYGGRHIKEQITWTCRFLEFYNPEECIKYIRDNSENADTEEAISAFQWTIKIFDDLERIR
jgi:heme oxygenase